MKIQIQIEIPELEPTEWKVTKDRAIAAFKNAEAQLKEAKASVLKETGQGSSLNVTDLVLEKLGISGFGYIPGQGINEAGAPNIYAIGPLGEKYPHYAEPHRKLLAIAIAFETICAEEGAIRRLVMKSVA